MLLRTLAVGCGVGGWSRSGCVVQIDPCTPPPIHRSVGRVHPSFTSAEIRLRMKISTVLKFVLLTMFLPLVTMRAQSVVYSGNFTSPYAALQDIGVSWSTFSTATVGVQVAVDPNALRLSFQKFQLETPSFSLTKTVSISAGFGGATKNYSVALNFNALTFVMSDGIASHSLSAGTGGNYSISGTTDLLHPTESLVLTGSYTIVGPTTTVTNAFSVQAAGTT